MYVTLSVLERTIEVSLFCSLLSRVGISWHVRGGWWCGCNSKQVALPLQIGATEQQCTAAALPSASVAKCKKACFGEVTEIGTDVEARKRGRQEQQPTTILLVEPPPAQLLLQPPQQPTHSLLAKEASVSNQRAQL